MDKTMPKLFGQDVSDETYELNKHLEAAPKQPKSDARQRLDAELKRKFARTFEDAWRLCGGPELEKEHYFDPERQWRADYLHRPTMTLIELEGGAWTNGRHVRGQGFINDCLKYNRAGILGYRLVRIPTGYATTTYLSQIIEELAKL